MHAADYRLVVELHLNEIEPFVLNSAHDDKIFITTFASLGGYRSNLVDWYIPILHLRNTYIFCRLAYINLFNCRKLMLSVHLSFLKSILNILAFEYGVSF